MPTPTPPHPNADVRMRGFAEKISVEQALTWLDLQLSVRKTIASESVALAEAHGRVLAESIVSEVNVPSFERAMMDGYALQAADVEHASDTQPVPLEVIGTCAPGETFEGEVRSGQALRIMTGAALPAGVDSVLPVEHTQLINDQVCAVRSQSVGKNLGPIGEDVQTGEPLFAAGRSLRPQDVGVLSSIGCASVEVVRRPRVSVVVTGNELLPAGQMSATQSPAAQPPTGNRIADANGPMLRALVQRDGGAPSPPGIVADDRDALLSALQADADLVITSGGSSVGQEDHLPTLLAEHGELAVHGVAMRPGSPVGMGLLNDRLILLLPGNPVACLWAYDLFAGRAIRSLGGRQRDWTYRKLTCKLTSAVASRVGRTDYERVTISHSTAELVQKRGASTLSSTTQADGFIVVPDEVASYAAGDQVDVFLYD